MHNRKKWYSLVSIISRFFENDKEINDTYKSYYLGSLLKAERRSKKEKETKAEATKKAADVSNLWVSKQHQAHDSLLAMFPWAFVSSSQCCAPTTHRTGRKKGGHGRKEGTLEYTTTGIPE